MSLQLSFSDLVKRAANLDLEEYGKFISTVNKLRAKRKQSNISKKESDLLSKINKGFPNEKWQRMQLLDEKMEAGNLSKSEYAELTALTDEYEKFTVDRIQLLKKLALLRNTTLEEVMHQLGLQYGEG